MAKLKDLEAKYKRAKKRWLKASTTEWGDGITIRNEFNKMNKIKSEIQKIYNQKY